MSRGGRFTAGGVEARVQTAMESARDYCDLLREGTPEHLHAALVVDLLIQARDEARETRRIVELVNLRVPS